MAFCSKCGKDVGEAKFCTGCGTPIAGGAPSGASNETKPRTVRAGQVKQCPSCGNPIESFQGRCPSCGHELGDVKVAASVKEFARVLSMSDEEQERMAIDLDNYIQNYPIPNNREDLLEFAILVFSHVNDDIQNQKWPLRVWLQKWDQVMIRSKIVLAGDQESLAKINELNNPIAAYINREKKKKLIIRGSLAGALLIFAIVIIINTTGIFVKVPASAAIPAENVYIIGTLDGYFKAAGDGFVVSSNSDGTILNVSLELEAVKNKMPEIEKQIADFIKSKSWNQSNCSYELYRYSEFHISGFEGIYSYGKDFSMEAAQYDSIVSSLLRMSPGETKKINIPIATGEDSSPGKKKRNVSKLMNMDSIQLGFDLQYDVKNNSNNRSDRVKIK